MTLSGFLTAKIRIIRVGAPRRLCDTATIYDFGFIDNHMLLRHTVVHIVAAGFRRPGEMMTGCCLFQCISLQYIHPVNKHYRNAERARTIGATSSDESNELLSGVYSILGISKQLDDTNVSWAFCTSRFACCSSSITSSLRSCSDPCLKTDEPPLRADVRLLGSGVRS
jgi:hypothetical protein